MITVVNKRNFKPPEDTSNAFVIRIDRTSPLGNPFRFGADGERDECVMKYKEYFHNAVKEKGCPLENAVNMIREAYLANRDVYLVCWCAPLACHGDIIKEYIINTPLG